ncbi:MAG: hypothetical protein K5659_03325 [Lachnospiraceae bacterium]|nr:hypothetical protein [Lachnospiraceae bacterium]
MTKKIRKSLFLGLMALLVCLYIFMSLNIHVASATVVMGDQISYGDYIPGSTWTTHYYYVNNNIAYCVEPKEPSVPSGNYYNIQTANSHQLNLLCRVLAYGYGGPYDLTASIWPGASDTQRYLYTHIAAAYAYQSGYTLEITGLTEEQLESTGIGTFLRTAATAEMHYGEVNIVIPEGSFQDLSFLAYFQQREDVPVNPELTVTFDIVKKDALDVYQSSFYSLENAEYGLYDSNNTLIESHKTDANGHIVFEYLFNAEGEYYISEITPSKGYKLDNSKYSFSLSKSGNELVLNGSSLVSVNNNVVSIESLENPYMANLSLYKTDEETGKKIYLSGAVFKIKDVSTGQYLKINSSSDLSTNDNGEITIPYDIRYGTYVIEESKAPYGYTKAAPVTVTIDNTKGYEVNNLGNVQCRVEIKEKPVYGSLSIYKKGEMLTGYLDGEFIFTERMLSGVTYELYADENIYTYDNNKTSGQRDMVYAKDQLVKTIVTTDAVAVVEHLPIGKYYLVEVSAPEGYEVDSSRISVTVSGDNNETLNPVINALNVRKKALIHIEKKDDDEIKVSGAKYGLYAGEDIMDADGNLLVSLDELIKEYVTDENGYIDFGENLPLFKFYVKELEAPYGYLRDLQVYDLDIKSAALNDEVTNLQVTDSMSKGVISLKKYADDLIINNGEITTETLNLSGARWQLIAAEDIYTYQALDDTLIYAKDEVISEKVTDENGNIIWDDLLPGKYILKETEVPYGVVLHEDVIETELIYTDDMTNIMSCKISATDEVNIGKITLIKTGEGLTDYKDGQFIYEEVGLKDSTWEIRADGDIVSNITGNILYNDGQLIDSKDTDEEGVIVFDNLPLGKYVLKEIKAPYGCVLSDEIIHVSLEGDNEKHEVISSVSAYNERQHISINMNKISNWGAPLKGCEFELINNEDIYSYDGRLLVKAGNVVSTTISNEDGSVIFDIDLPNCIYTIRESKSADGFYNYGFEEVIDFSYSEDKSQVEELIYGKTLVNDYIYGSSGRIFLVLGSRSVKTMHKMDDLGIGGYSLILERTYDYIGEYFNNPVYEYVYLGEDNLTECELSERDLSESRLCLVDWLFGLVCKIIFSMITL